MAECNIKLRHEGKPYLPRTCAKCKLGPCQDGQDYAGLTARIRELEAQLAEAQAALDAGVEGAGFWRFWQKKAAEYVSRLADAETRAARAEGILAGMRAEPNAVQSPAEVWRRAMEAAAQSFIRCFGGDENAPRWLVSAIRTTPLPDDLR